MCLSLAADASVLPLGLNFALSTPACTCTYVETVNNNVMWLGIPRVRVAALWVLAVMKTAEGPVASIGQCIV